MSFWAMLSSGQIAIVTSTKRHFFLTLHDCFILSWFQDWSDSQTHLTIFAVTERQRETVLAALLSTEKTVENTPLRVVFLKNCERIKIIGRKRF